MAIQCDFDYRGITITNAYIRVERFIFNSKTWCRAYLAVWPSQEVADSSDPLAADPSCVDFIYDFESPLSLHAQAYNAAKLLPEFAEAQDV